SGCLFFELGRPYQTRSVQPRKAAHFIYGFQEAILFEIGTVSCPFCEPCQYQIAISSAAVAAVCEIIIHARRGVGEYPECSAFEESRQISVAKIGSESTFQHGDGYYGETCAVIPIGRSFGINAARHVFMERVR